MDALGVYLLALAGTLVIELAVALWLAPAAARRRVWPVALFLNLFTHPLGTLLLTGGQVVFAATEMLILLTEVCGYRVLAELSWGRAFSISVVANALTTAVAVSFWL